MYFSPLTSNSDNLEHIKKIYLQSFPEAERRPWNSVLKLIDSSSSPYSLYALCTEQNQSVGLISIWNLDNCLYIEHFAIDPECRSNGLGSQTLDLLKKIAQSRPILLEVEPLTCGEMAHRRQGFYQRNGFEPHSQFPYMQPPYSDDQPAVPLTLMTYGKLDLPKAASQLHSVVYGIAQ